MCILGQILHWEFSYIETMHWPQRLCLKPCQNVRSCIWNFRSCIWTSCYASEFSYHTSEIKIMHLKFQVMYLNFRLCIWNFRSCIWTSYYQGCPRVRVFAGDLQESPVGNKSESDSDLFPTDPGQIKSNHRWLVVIQSKIPPWWFTTGGGYGMGGYLNIVVFQIW